MDTVASDLLLDSANTLLASSNVFFDSYILPVLLAIIGTAVGAYVAFANERRQKRKETRDKDFMAGKETQFTLITQLETLVDINRYLDEYKNDSERYMKIRKIYFNPTHPSIPLNKLSFMLKGEGAEILHQIVKIEETFFTAIESIISRNTIHNDFQKELPEVTRKTLISLKDLTNQIYDLFEKTIPSYKDIQQCLKEYLEKKFERKSLSSDFFEDKHL